MTLLGPKAGVWVADDEVAFSHIFEESVQLLLPRVQSLDSQSVANATRRGGREKLSAAFEDVTDLVVLQPMANILIRGTSSKLLIWAKS